MDDLVARLKRSRVVAIVRADDAAAAERVAVALVEAGIDLVELPLTTPGAAGAIARVREQVGERAWVGAGTVLTGEQVAEVAAAGAQFVVTPAVTSAVAEATNRGLPVLAGAFTPTEVCAALNLGAVAVKLFPAGPAGVAHLKAVRDPLPHVPFVPVGGVTAALAAEYLEAGAVAVGVGGPLVGDAVRGGSLSELQQRAAQFVALRQRLSVTEPRPTPAPASDDTAVARGVE